MSITHRVMRAWMSACLGLSVIFCKLINEGSWGATRLRQILFQIGKNFYGDFSDVSAGLWRGLFEPFAMPRVVPAFQTGQNAHRRRPQIWTAFHVNGRRSRRESACCDSSKSSPKCLWSCWRSRNLWKFVPHDFNRKTEDASCCRKICATSADASLLIHEFFKKHETTVVPQSPYTPGLAPADIFLFPKWKSSLKGRLFQTVEEIEENSIRDLRAVPQNMFQDTFQKRKKCWERCIKSGGEYFEGEKFD